MSERNYNISPETVASMWKFFMKTSVPRLIKQQREEKSKEESA